MLIEFGHKDTAFLSNKGILRYVFLLFFKKYCSLCYSSLFSLKNIHTFVQINRYIC